MRTRGLRSPLRIVALLAFAGTFAFAAFAAGSASGLQPGDATEIPESAFRPVVLPPGPGAAALTAPLGPPTARPTPDLRPIVEPLPAATAPAPRPDLDVPEPRPIVVAVPTPTPEPRIAATGGGGGGGGSISGNASWYCRAGVSPCTYTHPDTPDFDAYAAAGPRLRAAIGSSWRGRIVRVDGIRVKLIDWCQCYKGEPHEKLLDLYYDVYARTGTNVTVRW